MSNSYSITPVGFIRSSLTNRSEAPKQGHEGAPDAWPEILPEFSEALDGIGVGQETILISWLHQSRREVLKVHPRGNKSNPLSGVCHTLAGPPQSSRTTSCHCVGDSANKLKIGPLEAIDGTPVVDIKPVLSGQDL